MLCQNCWREEAWVHFHCFEPHGVHTHSYCLACSQDEPLSWLLTWGHRQDPDTGSGLGDPEVLPARPLFGARRPATLVATAVVECDCGCRVVAGAELPCNHRACSFEPRAVAVDHLCHCGRELVVPLPDVVCRQCGATESRSVIAAVETCLWDEQRRRICCVDSDMRRGRATWGTFAIRN